MRAVNLLPSGEARREQRLRPLPLLFAVLALAAVAGGLFVAAARSDAIAAERTTDLRIARARLAALPIAPPVSPALARLATARAGRVAALATLLSARLPWDRTLRRVAAALPRDVWLSRLAATVPGSAPADPAAPAAAPEPGLALEGYTYSHPSVARALARLARVPGLANVRLVRSELAPTGSGRRRIHFQVTADVRAGGAS